MMSLFILALVGISLLQQSTFLNPKTQTGKNLSSRGELHSLFSWILWLRMCPVIFLGLTILFIFTFYTCVFLFNQRQYQIKENQLLDRLPLVKEFLKSRTRLFNPEVD